MLNLTTAILVSIVVMLISAGVGMYLARYKSSVTEMLGMMIGMTQGMMTGIAVGYFIGAATDMFVSNLVGVIVGLAFGIIFGRVGGLMGMMGAMLGVMLQYLYNGWAITVTNVLIGAIYLVSMFALVRLVQQGAAAQMEIDPVCNMKVDPKTSLQHVHEGRTYYFCAPSCQRAFAKSAETYLKEGKA
jgi:YHS domain-containing protein